MDQPISKRTLAGHSWMIQFLVEVCQSLQLMHFCQAPFQEL